MWSKKNIKRVNQIDSFFIPHARIEKAINTIEKGILLSENSKEPQNVVLYGNAGTGKTTACEAIVNAREQSYKVKNGCEVTIVPAFYCNVPSPVTIKTVASQMLKSLGDPKPTIGVANDLTNRLGKLLLECETKVILLDELQHLLLKENASVALDVRNWLKTIINEFKVPIIAVGTPDCNSVINNCSQLSRRFTLKCELKNLSFGQQDSEFSKFIIGLEQVFIEQIDFLSFPGFRSRNKALSVYISTGGNPSDTLKIFKFSALEALSNNREKVEMEDFANAFDSLDLPNYLKKFKGNPFLYSESELNRVYSLI